ncbi:helix-turn-helix domain-containing protein [Allonocardiopsis opalescens]|uniref:XRE family transcriptional regulator n=1 Tax=Allonocardiopsis opalescens TaxID=1144618 RepID=A0A2T0Q6S2_9ACTN|nr:XRE family transcriptional regulator [Allonocardiopsis opalescens]PRX99526.1 XRE family transcriptional regulator [Allonocardiopsis opalescens]
MTDPTAVSQAIARNVRANRTARGWSLDLLAQRAQVSKGVLVALEQGRGNPNLATLVRVADSFGLPITRLVETEEPPNVRVIGPERRLRLWTGEAGGHGTLVANTDPPHAIELWHWLMLPGERHSSSSHGAGVRELIHVESGALLLTAEESVHRVPAGSSIVFPGDRAHGYAADGGEPVRFTLAVLVPPVPE